VTLHVEMTCARYITVYFRLWLTWTRDFTYCLLFKELVMKVLKDIFIIVKIDVKQSMIGNEIICKPCCWIAIFFGHLLPFDGFFLLVFTLSVCFIDLMSRLVCYNILEWSPTVQCCETCDNIRNTIYPSIQSFNFQISYRVTHKGWDFRDDCTVFILFVSYYLCFKSYLQSNPLRVNLYITNSWIHITNLHVTLSFSIIFNCI